MGPAIDAVRPALAVTGRNPAFLAAALLTLTVSGASSLVVGRVPVVGEVVNSVLVTPALAALLLGMASAGLVTDAASLGDGVESLRASYRSLAGAYALLVAGVLVAVVAWTVQVTVAVVAGGGVDVPRLLAVSRRTSLAAATDPTAEAVDAVSIGPETAGLVLILTLLTLALVLVGGLAVQFFDVAVVVDGESALSSFAASWRLFREAPASVLGYSVLRMLPIVAAGALVAGGYSLGESMAGDLGGVLVALPVVAVAGPLTFAFVTAYHVAYYEERAGRLPDDRLDFE